MSATPSVSTKTIVVATDLSPAAAIAVEQAARLAQSKGARLWILHVFNDSLWASIKNIYDSERWSGDEPVLAARKHLSEQVRRIADSHGIVVSGETRTGRATTEIAHFLTECRADLLVVGEHGEDWIGDAVIGGTALNVLERASVPVMLVRRLVSADFPTVIVATDFSANAERALRLALDWFGTSTLYVVHAYSVPFEGRMRMAGATDADIEHYRIDERQRARNALQALRSSLVIPEGAPIHWLDVAGQPAVALCEMSERLAADLVIVGKHGGSPLEERIIGSVTQNVLYHASSNVLLVP
ncbi:MAG: universal stress protein [Rhodocyclaceae bacterium]